MTFYISEVWGLDGTPPAITTKHSSKDELAFILYLTYWSEYGRLHSAVMVLRNFAANIDLGIFIIPAARGLTLKVLISNLRHESHPNGAQPHPKHNRNSQHEFEANGSVTGDAYVARLLGVHASRHSAEQKLLDVFEFRRDGDRVSLPLHSIKLFGTGVVPVLPDPFTIRAVSRGVNNLSLHQHCFLVILIALLLEAIETGETYKLIRPYKYYQRRPWRPPRWHKGHRSSKFYHSKRIPPEDYYSRGPGYYRYHPVSEDFESHVENKPYTIVIQLPKGEYKYSHNDYHRKRNYERDLITRGFATETDYIEDSEDNESKVVNVNSKKVQIKMIKGENPKLHIKISRSDIDKDIEITDKLNSTAVDLLLLTKVDVTQPMDEDWTSSALSTVYPENI
ncbi:uncharacterized protein LOC143182754 [Calliopsis andreniformis]|uniref:uncharacterized protein LOC143182754 n=1 Tax=Calliopsis andreniformis TaxID=337506 RepID=UPI003FCDEA73